MLLLLLLLLLPMVEPPLLHFRLLLFSVSAYLLPHCEAWPLLLLLLLLLHGRDGCRGGGSKAGTHRTTLRLLLLLC